MNKNSWIYLCLKVFKNRKNKNFIDNISNINNDFQFVKMEKNINCKNDKCVCKIIAGGKNDGFFACVRWAIDSIYFCDYYALNPVILFPEDSLYKDKDDTFNINPFEYYFRQPLNNSINDLKEANTIIECCGRNRNLAENLNNGISYKTSDEYINEMAKIVKKYLKFNDETKSKIEEELKERKIENDVLGVHIRGTDYKKNYKNHPTYIPIEMYYEEIDKALQQYGFKKIFIATDDKEILNNMIKRYTEEKVIYGKNIARGEGNEGVHTIISEREHNGYLLGLEVIFDMCSLSKCGGIISGMSQVGLISRIYKKSNDELYIYDKLLSNGINKKGKIFNVKK